MLKKSPTFCCLERKKSQFLRTNSLVENHLNSKFCRISLDFLQIPFTTTKFLFSFPTLVSIVFLFSSLVSYAFCFCVFVCDFLFRNKKCMFWYKFEYVGGKLKKKFSSGQFLEKELHFFFTLPAFSQNYNHPYAEKTECQSSTFLELWKPFKLRKWSNTLTAKEYVPNTLETVILPTTSLPVYIFTLIFFNLRSILNTKAKCVLLVMTATGALMLKGCSKIIIKIHLLELLHFCEVFNFFYRFIKCMHMPNDVKNFTMWKTFAQHL